MEISPVALARRLWEEPAAEQDPGASPYLLEHVLNPYLRGGEIRIGNIDYAAFSPQEMGAFLRHVNQLAEENRKIERLWASLCKCKPLVKSKRTFC